MLREIAHTLVSWGPLGAFLLALLDSAGIPLPAGVDALMIAVPAMDPSLTYLSAGLAVFGSLIGSLFLFYAARKGGTLYLNRHATPERTQTFRGWFRRYGLVTVFIPCLVPIPMPLKVFILLAGVCECRTSQFVLVVLAARVPRYFGLAYLGSQLGEHSTAWLQQHAWELVGLAAGLLAFLFLLLKLADRWRRPAAALE